MSSLELRCTNWGCCVKWNKKNLRIPLIVSARSSIWSKAWSSRCSALRLKSIIQRTVRATYNMWLAFGKKKKKEKFHPTNSSSKQMWQHISNAVSPFLRVSTQVREECSPVAASAWVWEELLMRHTHRHRGNRDQIWFDKNFVKTRSLCITHYLALFT